MDPFGITIQDIYRLMLIMFRTGALLMTVPVFGHVAIPRQLRIWLIIILAFVIFPSPVIETIETPSTTFQLALVILVELAVGFAMGFAVIILFAAVQFAGHIIGLQMGLAVANIMDPMSATQISIIGEFYYLVSLLIFLMIDGHHFVIRALVWSFELIPVGGMSFGPDLGDYILALTVNLFVLGIKLATPLIITLFILNVVMGIVSRTVPQMNVFIVGFPLAIGVGLVMIRLSLPFFKVVLINAFQGLETDVMSIINLLR